MAYPTVDKPYGLKPVNLIGGLNRAVMAEGLSFAEAMGLELEAFLEVLRASAAYSRTMGKNTRS